MLDHWKNPGKSEYCILTSWQVVRDRDEFLTLVDTFSNVNVLLRNKLCSNDWSNGFKGEHSTYYGFKPWHCAPRGVRLCAWQRNNYDRIMKRKRLWERDYGGDLGHGGKRLHQQDETALNQVQHDVKDTISSFLETVQFTPTRAPACGCIFFL